MMAASQYKQGPEAKLKGWHVLLMMLAFFGVMFTVNGIFLYSAITSFPGEDVEKSYLQGLSYNDTLEARREQAELGWTIRAGLLDGAVPRLRVEVADAAGEALSMLEVRARLRRQATTLEDTDITLAPAGERGVYEVALTGLSKGQWEIDITARSADGDTEVEAVKTVVLR